MISLAGEVSGALIAFLLYRKGFKKKTGNTLLKYPRLNKLVNASGRDAFYLIFLLRLIPFIPSGLITFAAAVGKVSTANFLLQAH